MERPKGSEEQLNRLALHNNDGDANDGIIVNSVRRERAGARYG